MCYREGIGVEKNGTKAILLAQKSCRTRIPTGRRSPKTNRQTKIKQLKWTTTIHPHKKRERRHNLQNRKYKNL